MTRDRGTGIISIILGGCVAVLALQFPKSSMLGDIGPAVFPLIAAGILIICGTGLLIKKTERAGRFLDQNETKRLLLITCVYIGYAALLWAVGFLIATPIAVFVLCIMLSNRKTALWKCAIYAVIVTTVVYLCFYTLLGLKLPVGKFVKFMI